MTQKHLKILESIFDMEVSSRLPFQSKSKLLTELEQMGMVEPMNAVFGSGAFAVHVSGWNLTHRGRIAYCDTCKEP